MKLDTVGDLMSYLTQFDPDKPIAVDIDGNVLSLESDSVRLWDNEGSFVALFVQGYVDEVERTISEFVDKAKDELDNLE